MAKFVERKSREQLLEEQIENLETQKSDKLTYKESDDNEIEVKN